MSARAGISSLTGVTSPPRSNGELVFEEPWQARAFGLAVGLVEEAGLDWEEFRSRLIEEIGVWEARNEEAAADTWSYYERWVSSLHRLVVETGMLSAEEIEDRIRLVLAEDDHDHHDHDHHHRHDR